MVKNHAIKHWRELMAEKLGTAFGAEPLRNYPPAQAEAMPAPAAGQAQSDVAKQQPPIGH
jgi:hypothetical protein